MDKETKEKPFSINPIVGTVLVAMIGLFGTGIGASIGGYYNIKLEREKLRSSLILKAVETTDPQSALNYLKLLKTTGLVEGIESTILEWEKDSLTSIPLRPRIDQIALDEMGSVDRSIRIAATEKLINEQSDNPETIREVLKSIREPKTANELFNNFVFLNATVVRSYDEELIQVAMDEILLFERDVREGKIPLGNKTRKALTNYKNYLVDIKKKL